MSILKDIDGYLAAVHAHLSACQLHCGIVHDKAIHSTEWHEAVAQTMADFQRTYATVQRLAGFPPPAPGRAYPVYETCDMCGEDVQCNGVDGDMVRCDCGARYLLSVDADGNGEISRI